MDARNGGDPDFFFLPPYGFDPAPESPLSLEVGSSLTVEICAWRAASCLGSPFARYTLASGPGGERIQICSTCPAYFVLWNTADFALQPQVTYRLRVLVAERELGHADILIVYSSNESAQARQDGFIPVLGREALSLYFKIIGQIPAPRPVYEWIARAPLPVAVRAAAGASDGRRIYVLGGNQGFASYSNLVQIFDPATNTWSSGTPFVGTRDFAMAAALSDGIHLLGGNAPAVLNDHQVYDRERNSWSARRPLPVGTAAAAAVVLNGKLYVIGGGYGSARPTAAVQIYDPVTDSWAMGAAMPTARMSTAAAVLGGKIYVAGGQIQSVGTTNVLERYDPATDSWTSLAPLPVALEALGGGSVANQFCVFGGRRAEPNPTGAAFAQTYCYDPTLNTWSAGPDMLTPRVEPVSVEWDGGVYVLGGRTPNAFASAAVERLQPASRRP